MNNTLAYGGLYQYSRLCFWQAAKEKFEMYDESVRFNNKDKADFANIGKIVNAVFLLSSYVLLTLTKHI